MLNGEQLGNDLNRSVKLAMDSGEARSAEEAQKIFQGYRLSILVGPDVAVSATKQAALLTAVNTGRRCFLGSVEVTGCPDAGLLVPWQKCRTLAEAVVSLGGTLTNRAAGATPQIVIGDANTDQSSDFCLRATFDGWRGGIVPFSETRRLAERHEFTPAGVLSGALAVSEAFQYVRGRNALAGRRSFGLSLWEPESKTCWLDSKEPGPAIDVLPSRLWLIGLGHLGQAYLWTLGFLPYRDAGSVDLVLQDYDHLVKANDSTSLLTSSGMVGKAKTRAMAEWCEQRGFRVRLIERRFDKDFKINDEEPHLALCGVDNEPARAVLEDVGFTQVIEAGLGKGGEEYLALQIHCFPGERSARSRWGIQRPLEMSDSLSAQPAYQALADAGIDKCGLTMLSNRSVGASFVGAATAALVIAELLRLAIGAHRYEVIDGSLRSFKSFQFVRSEELSCRPFNPGTTEAVERNLHPNNMLAA
jgi:hypothetical protein